MQTPASTFYCHLFAMRAIQLFTSSLILILSSFHNSANTQNLPKSVQQALQTAAVPSEAMSAYVVELSEASQPRLKFRENEMMQPASVMKVVTTFAALDLLGADHTWKTQFLADGKIDNGILKGNLVIKGGGDPKWVLERIESDFSLLKQAGINQVQGDLILDRSLFQLPTSDPRQFDGDPLKPYNATPDGLLVNFKAMTLTFSPPESGKEVDNINAYVRISSIPPQTEGLISPLLRANSGACSPDWRQQLEPVFLPTGEIQWNGSYASSCGEKSWTIASPYPDSFSAHVLQTLLKKSTIELTGKTRYGVSPTQAQLLFQSSSLPLSSIIQDINKYSNNVMAQQVFLSLGFTRSNHSSFESAQQSLYQWWQTKIGANFNPPILENGSGLSRVEKMTASSIAQLLKVASLHNQGSVFLQSLPVVGVDGTAKMMGIRMGNSPAIGKVFVKTGTLKDVVAIAGYAIATSGKRYIVVGMINHDNASQARPALDALIEFAVKDEENKWLAFRSKKKLNLH